MPRSHRPRPGLSAGALLLSALVAASAAFAGLGAAQDHSTAVRVLHHSRDFRARVRAALALGATSDPSVVPPLVEALSDRNGAVRAAAATALGRLGQPSAIAPLRRLERDRERVVRTEAQQAIRRIEAAQRAAQASASGPQHRRALPSRRGNDRYPTIAVVPRAREITWRNVNYVVVIGDMEDRSNFRHVDLSQQLLAEVDRNLLVLRGVAVLHDGSIPAEAERQIRRRRLPKLRLEGSINRVERTTARREVSVRCEVSLMILDEPGRAIRSVLSGAATGRSERRGQRTAQERALAQQALTGAVRSAMTGAARAIASAGQH